MRLVYVTYSRDAFFVREHGGAVALGMFLFRLALLARHNVAVRTSFAVGVAPSSGSAVGRGAPG
jgi:hypothetical protein